MRRSATLALCLVGLFVSLYLLYSYTSPSRPMVCIGTGCDAVRASDYSSVAGVPMPLFGVLGYTLLAIAIVAESLFSGGLARVARQAFLGMTGIGFLVSIYLEYLQAFVIHAYCAWCITSGVAMTGLFVLAIVSAGRSGPEPDPAAQLTRVRSLFAVSIAGVLVGVPTFYFLAGHGEAAPSPPQATQADLQARLVRPGSHETGNPNAPLTVVEFGDFECPVCGRGEAAARETRNRYAQQVRFVFRQFPLERIHPLAEKAAEASECAGEQGKFWEMVERIYARQEDLSVQGLERDAAELRLDGPRFHQCLASGALSQRVRQDMEDGRALGVRATPTFFIGQQRVEGILTAAQFSQLIAGQLGTTAPAATPPPSAARAKAPRPSPTPSSSAASAQPAKTPASTLGGLSGAGLGGPVGGLQGGAQIGALGGLAGGGAACNEADAGKKQPTMIDTEQLRRLLSDSPKPVFVDVRPAADYAAGRLPGAVNIPADEMGRRWSTLPRDRTIVLYESGRASGDICAAGKAAGRALLEYGFPEVKVYQDGLAGWERAGMSTEK